MDKLTPAHAAAEGRLEEDRPPEGRPDEERESHTGSEVGRALEAAVRGPGGAWGLEEEE